MVPTERRAMGIDELPFTNIQRKILAHLSDGYCHREGELIQFLREQDAPPINVRVQVSQLRKLLCTVGQGVASHRKDGELYYQIVRLIYKDQKIRQEE